MPISKKITAAKHGKVVDSVSVLRVALTTPEVYCEQYGIIFSETGTVADFKEDNRSEARKSGRFRVRSWGCSNNT